MVFFGELSAGEVEVLENFRKGIFGKIGKFLFLIKKY